MPEYHLDTAEAPAAFESASDMVKGFIEAAFFSSTSCYHSSRFFGAEEQAEISEGTADGTIPEDAGAVDLEPASLQSVIRLCADFAERADSLLQRAYALGYEEEQAGHDFYFTRAGHGVSFKDREELSECEDSERKAELQAEMRAEGTTPARWGQLLDMVKALDGNLAEELCEAAGRREVNLYAYQDEAAPCGFYVAIDCL